MNDSVTADTQQNEQVLNTSRMFYVNIFLKVLLNYNTSHSYMQRNQTTDVFKLCVIMRNDKGKSIFNTSYKDSF